MANKFWPAISLTGGGDGALDSIDGDDLSNEDMALVITSDGVYIYSLNTTSGATEDSPDTIAPDTNAGDKRWILQAIESASGLPYDAAYEAYLVTRK